MNEVFVEKELSIENIKDEPLTGLQKCLFGMICWGVQSWSQADSFKANGYEDL